MIALIVGLKASMRAMKEDTTARQVVMPVKRALWMVSIVASRGSNGSEKAEVRLVSARNKMPLARRELENRMAVAFCQFTEEQFIEERGPNGVVRQYDPFT